MRRVTIAIIFLSTMVSISISSCKKDFLDTKPNIKLSTISTLNDCELLLHNEDIFNRDADPGLGAIFSDEFYLLSDDWLSGVDIERNGYVFAPTIYPAGARVNDWRGPYYQVYYANVVLDALPDIAVNQSEANRASAIKGTALFYRSWAFYNLVQTFAMPFDAAVANTQPGVPLRLSSNFNVKSIRASQKDCFNQIISDIGQAIDLLPAVADRVTRPSKAAAKGLLARVYLALGDYAKAFQYSDESLQLKSDLLDYNDIDTSSPFFFMTDQSLYPVVEEIYHTTLNSYWSYTNQIVDSSLYSSYDSSDLRKGTFFGEYNGYKRFKGSYEFKNFGSKFSGLATDEMYLIRAECNARLGNTNEAMDDINTLLRKRYKTGSFSTFTASSSDEALNIILSERKKELCFRGIRWTDLRRLNQESQHAVTLTHIVDNVTFTLPPNDLRYAFPIPDSEIELSGIEQNPR